MNVNKIKQMKEQAFKASQLLKTMAHPVRLTVLCALIEEELNVGELQTLTAVSQSVLSQHLAILRAQNLVTTRRNAQTIFYQLSNNSSVKIIEVLHQLYCPK